MSGHLLRVRHPSRERHECDTPDQAEKGAVWQCDDCGKRWTCTMTVTSDVGKTDWVRRYWPWPRPEKVPPRMPDGYVPPSASVGVTFDPTYEIQPVAELPSEPATPPPAPSGVSSAHFGEIPPRVNGRRILIR